MSSNLTDIFINRLFELKQLDLSEKITCQAKMRILDYLGGTLAGARMIDEKASKLLKYLASSNGQATVIGFNRKTDMQNAVLINGLSSHVAELDDGNRFSMMHPGSPVISALLPLAEVEKIKIENLIKGIILGYEAGLKIALAIQPSHKEIGYHATGTCGTIAAAVGVAVALDFNKSQMKNALSSSVTSASGFLKMIEDGSDLKSFNAGRAAFSGLLAAFMARAGFSGPNEVLTGDRGFLTIMAKQFDLNVFNNLKESTLGIETVYMKPYAACRHCHPAIEAILKIRDKYELATNEIKKIEVFTYRLAVRGHDHSQVNGVTSAKMSIPYSVAVAFQVGKAGIDEFMPKYLNDQNVISLASKVKVEASEELTSLVPQKRPAVIKILTVNNKYYTERVELPKGEPENPINQDELEEKFFSLAKYSGKTQEEAKMIIEYVWDLENQYESLFELL